MDAGAAMLQLEIPPEYRKGISTNLKNAAKMAALVEQAKLDEEAEPAPVYRA